MMGRVESAGCAAGLCAIKTFALAYDVKAALPNFVSVQLHVWQLNDDEARHLLEPFKEAQVIILPHSRSLLCGIASDGDRREMNRLAQLLLRTPEWQACIVLP